jgi:hypothetical protein
MPFAPEKIAGWEYSASIFIFFNGVVFMVVAILYMMIYHEAIKNTHHVVIAIFLACLKSRNVLCLRGNFMTMKR